LIHFYKRSALVTRRVRWLASAASRLLCLVSLEEGLMVSQGNRLSVEQMDLVVYRVNFRL